MNNYEKIGRWLCKIYYSIGGIKFLPAEIISIIEKILQRDLVWISLMSGDLRKKTARQNFLGDPILEGYESIDGKENFIRVKELILYSTIGSEILHLLNS